LRFLMKSAHQFASRVVNAETDRSFQWRGNKTNADTSRG
jgi:hypothetical protein